jgi:hypothetical protein
MRQRDENLIDIETDKVVLEIAGARRRRAGRNQQPTDRRYGSTMSSR